MDLAFDFLLGLLTGIPAGILYSILVRYFFPPHGGDPC